MTYLHQLTFERIQVLNKEIIKLMPSGFNCDDDSKLDRTMPMDTESLELV